MINDLTAPQRELHDLMSSMSEQAWSAGWMQGLEYELWKAVQSPAYKVGRLQLGSTQCDRLRKLSEACGGAGSPSTISMRRFSSHRRSG